MNYQELFHRIWRLISSPASAWEEIRLEKDKQRVTSSFVYPLIGLAGLSVFVGTVISLGWGRQTLQIAMTNACALFVALFGGFFLVSYLTDKLGQGLLKYPSRLGLCQQFIGYAMVVPFVLEIVTGLIPSFLVIRLILQFYVVYVVWEGAQRLMRVSERHLYGYTLCVSALVLLIPWFIQRVFVTLITVFH